MKTSGVIRRNYEESGIDLPFFSGISSADFETLEYINPYIRKVSCMGKIWLLKKPKADNSLGQHLLHREYEISCKLQHPFIVSVVGYLTNDPEGPAIIMEYVEGRTLSEYIAEKPDTKDRKKVLFEILDAVDYLHAKGLLHNDIKADNIMISNIGNHVKIIDFGLSETESDPLFRRLGGTLESSAPEVLEGRTDISSDASSDIWSLGTIISELFPKKYSCIVKKCMKTNPLSRFHDVNSLKSAMSRHDRWPLSAAAAALLILLFAAAIIPDIKRIQKDRKAQVETENKKAQIEKDVKGLWTPTADSLHAQSLVGYSEFAQLMFSDFAEKLGQYRQKYGTPDNEIYLGIIDAAYEKIWKEYLQIMQELHSFNQLESSGKISAKESAWYSYLSSNRKRYVPYTGQTPPEPWWNPDWDTCFKK